MTNIQATNAADNLPATEPEIVSGGRISGCFAGEIEVWPYGDRGIGIGVTDDFGYALADLDIAAAEHLICHLQRAIAEAQQPARPRTKAPRRPIKHVVAGLDGTAEIFIHSDELTGVSVVLDLAEATALGEPVGISLTPAQATGLAHLLLDRAEAAQTQDIEPLSVCGGGQS